MSLEPETPTVILHDASTSRWLRFGRLAQIIEACQIDEVLPALQRIEHAVEVDGLLAAGFLSYEAAPAFDDALTVHDSSNFPLLWFGLFRSVEELDKLPATSKGHHSTAQWRPSISSSEYRQAISRIKDYIHDGDTYQVNFTYRLSACIDTDPYLLFRQMISAQKANYGGFIQTGKWAICSASPEMFFTLDGKRIQSRPMKGTARRGLTTGADRAEAAALRASEKNRAENVMIVDMVRNDLGRVCAYGSVRVSELFDLEKYQTLWQMTSMVEGETAASLTDILKALFPAASITGAPKVRTMEIISELETLPRRVYTGSMGFVLPGRKAQFNVGIRTVLVDRTTKKAEFGTGGGIVWDSAPDLERDEAKLKAQVLFEEPEPFSLLETMLWEPGNGYYLLERHINRLLDSAEYFDVIVLESQIREHLSGLALLMGSQRQRVRLLVAQNGSVETECHPIPAELPQAQLSVAVAESPVDSRNPFLYHKTTHRRVYEDARTALPEYDDVILYNERGEVTESTIANVVIKLEDGLFTPPVPCGLLAGTERTRMLDEGLIAERVILIDDLKTVEAVFLVNSVRGMVGVDLALPGQQA